MFDFWREVIINDKATLERELKVYTAGKVDTIYKTIPSGGTSAVIEVPTTTEGVVEITLGLSVGQSGEYAHPFGASKKVFTVEAPTEKSLKEVFAGIANVDTASGAYTITLIDPKVKVISVVEHTVDDEGKISKTENNSDWIEVQNELPVGTGA